MMDTLTGMKKNPMFFRKKSAVSSTCSSRSAPQKSRRRRSAIATMLGGTATGRIAAIHSPAAAKARITPICSKIRSMVFTPSRAVSC